MVQETFYVKGKKRYEQTKKFIRTNMKTARFLTNPYYLDFSDEWNFNISYEIEDMNKLSELRQKYYNEDNPPIQKKKNLVDKILNYFKS